MVVELGAPSRARFARSRPFRATLARARATSPPSPVARRLTLVAIPRSMTEDDDDDDDDDDGGGGE